MKLLDELKEARDNLGAVLCDPKGNACIHGSDGDMRIIDAALTTLTTIIERLESPELVEDAAKAICFVHMLGLMDGVTHKDGVTEIKNDLTRTEAEAAVQAVLGGEKFKRVRLDQAND